MEIAGYSPIFDQRLFRVGKWLLCISAGVIGYVPFCSILCFFALWRIVYWNANSRRLRRFETVLVPRWESGAIHSQCLVVTIHHFPGNDTDPYADNGSSMHIVLRDLQKIAKRGSFFPKQIVQ